MADNEIIAARLKAARKIAGYETLKQFCEKFDIPESTYSQHETARRGIKIETLNIYANYLGLNADWLAYGSGNPFQHGDIDQALIDKFHQEIKQATNKPAKAELDEKLFTSILETFFMLLKEHQLDIQEIDAKTLSSALMNIYNDVIVTSDDPKIRKQLIFAMFKPYIIILFKQSL